VARCLAKDPAARYPNGAALAAELRGLRGPDAWPGDPRERPTLPFHPPPYPAGLQRPVPMWRRPITALASAALIATAVIGTLWLQPRQGTTPPSSPPPVDEPASSATTRMTPAPALPDAPRREPRTPASGPPSSAAPARTPDRNSGLPSQPSPQPAVPASVPQPEAAAPPAPAAASLDGVWTVDEQLAEGGGAIECAASGALQIKAGNGALAGSLRLKQDCKDTSQKTTDSTEAITALTAGSIAGDDVSFGTRHVDGDLATTCRYSGVVGSSRATMTGVVTCEARETDRAGVLTLRGAWRADRTTP
jgi:hypothetical protein